MLVKELIEKLSKCNPNDKIEISFVEQQCDGYYSDNDRDSDLYGVAIPKYSDIVYLYEQRRQREYLDERFYTNV